LISGYLITKSYIQSRTIVGYFIKRIIRIVPAYIVVFWICVLCVAPFVGSEVSVISIQNLKNGLLATLRLLPPHVPGAFHGLPYDELNGSMWTIAYEFRCYIAAAFLGFIGLYKPCYRIILLLSVAMLVTLNATDASHSIQNVNSSLISLIGPLDRIVGSPDHNIKFFAVFGVGALYYVFRDWIVYTWPNALIAGGVLITLMFNHFLAEAAFMIFGGYIIFWFSFKVPVLSASRLDNNDDISYGLYLYAWPIQNLIIWNDRNISPWLLCVISLLGAGILGYASWKMIEKPSLNLFKKRMFFHHAEIAPRTKEVHKSI